MISAQPAQKASGWWKASPWLARRWSGVIVCQQECRRGGTRGLLPLPLRRQGEARRGRPWFGLNQQHTSPAISGLRRGGRKARRRLLALARDRNHCTTGRALVHTLIPNELIVSITRLET